MVSKGGGNYDHCQVDKTQAGLCNCTHFMKSAGNKPANCEVCKLAAKQVTHKYSAAHKVKGGMGKKGSGKMEI